jgi:hypothetical protein
VTTRLYTILVVVVAIMLAGLFYLLSLLFHDPSFFSIIGIPSVFLFIMSAVLNRIFYSRNK